MSRSRLGDFLLLSAQSSVLPLDLILTDFLSPPSPDTTTVIGSRTRGGASGTGSTRAGPTAQERARQVGAITENDRKSECWGLLFAFPSFFHWLRLFTPLITLSVLLRVHLSYFPPSDPQF